MNLHEYQAKALLGEYGIAVPPGVVAATPGEAEAATRALGGDRFVVKAQVHAGGRGKAGGVCLVDGVDGVVQAAARLLGSRLVTLQSGPAGQPVTRVLIETRRERVHELYLGMMVDRRARRVAVMGSRAGGMNIEEIAAKEPQRIRSFRVDPVLGLLDYQSRRLGFDLELEAAQRQQLGAILKALYRLFIERDASLIEVNPLIVDGAGRLEALDAKIALDDNALYRQNIANWRDAEQEDERERRAREHDLNYVTLGGDIACMVNGAGLAMATMDIIQLAGGTPANFLDVGGGTTAARVTEAFKLIVSDARVKVILVNIFGGIVRCDLIAEGIVAAVNEVGVDLPVVVRLEGTNAEAGRTALAASGLAIIAAEDLGDAARKAVAAANRAA